MRVLVVAVSARMLAQLAVADGYEVTALDRFGDVDLRAIAPGATAPSSDALAALAAGIEADAVVYGAGLENRPDLVAQLADGRELLGTPAELLAAVRDPWAVGAAARAAGARAPRRPGRPASSPAAPGAERMGCASRGAVAAGAACAAGRAAGCARPRSSSAASTGCRARRWRSPTGGDAAVLGLTEQLHRPPGFGWTGNVTPPRLPEGELAELDGQLRAVCAEVAARFGVRGAFGVDAVWDGRHAWVLEVNPRPPAVARAVRPRQLRGARPGRPRSRPARAGSRRRRGVRR